MTTTFDELFTVPTKPKPTIAQQAAAVQVNPPVMTATTATPTRATEIIWTAKQVTASIGTIFVVFKNSAQEQQLKDDITWIYQNRNQPCCQMSVDLDRVAHIKSNRRGVGPGGKTTWRDFVEGVYQDKVVRGRDFTQPQLKNITRLFKTLGLPDIKFKKV